MYSKDWCTFTLKMKLIAYSIQNLKLEFLKNYENVSWSKVKVKMSKALNYFERK